MLESIFSSRVVKPLIITATGASLISGCSSGNGHESSASSSSSATSSSSMQSSSSHTVTPAIETTCKPEMPEKWEGFPTNFDAQRIAQKLGVSAAALMTEGRFGGATCAEPLPVNRIGSSDAPIVSVKGEGSPCLVIGTQEDPRTITSTPNILAICAPQDNQTTSPTTQAAPSTLPTT